MVITATTTAPEIAKIDLDRFFGKSSIPTIINITTKIQLMMMP